MVFNIRHVKNKKILVLGGEGGWFRWNFVYGDDGWSIRSKSHNILHRLGNEKSYDYINMDNIRLI